MVWNIFKSVEMEQYVSKRFEYGKITGRNARRCKITGKVEKSRRMWMQKRLLPYMWQRLGGDFYR